MDNLDLFPYHFLVRETFGQSQSEVPLRFGLPLPEGEFHDRDLICIKHDNGKSWPCDIEPLAFWPDKSIRWCLLTGYIDLNPGQEMHFHAVRQSQHNTEIPTQNDSRISQSDKQIEVSTRNFIFKINREVFTLLDTVQRLDGSTVIEHADCRLVVENGEIITPKCTDISCQSHVIGGEELGITLKASGEFRNHQKALCANFESTIDFDIKSNRVRCSFTLHNPLPAIHQGGIWDLGDPNSLKFKSMELSLELSDAPVAVEWRADHKQDWHQLTGNDLEIYQESSGGENWNSPNHVNADNEVPLNICGYVCHSVGEQIANGQRAQPTLHTHVEDFGIDLGINQFWQTFPKALSVQGQSLTLGLFPKQFCDNFELQPGERKTHEFYIQLGTLQETPAYVEEPPEVILNPQWIAHCRVFPFFRLIDDVNPLQEIINTGLDDKKGFLAKREIIDEYGWRNFGDLFADHETEGSKLARGQFVSHYNNQYDPIYGFLRQFALSGNYRWFVLADDLARHVVDIDIYHTNHDKDEYNNGLFWHTDHYQEVKTASHRTYSSLQKKDVYVDHAGGGGPGGQHCYTTGLLFHYYLTGYHPSRQAVEKLTSWILKTYEGSGTLTGLLLTLKNHSLQDIGRYPLDRGTGNYLRAILDVYDLTQDCEYLNRAGCIIQHTIHPADNLPEKDLLNVEDNWYYTVFFQVLTRYLRIKEGLNELDEQFYFARDALLHYADWMATHEQPYLKNPDILEFPNNTWAAQDLRKVNLLLSAEYYAPEENDSYRHKAEIIYRDSIQRIGSDPNRHYTRILAILMQNQGPFDYYSTLESKPRFAAERSYPGPAADSKLLDLMNFTRELLALLRNFSMKNELRWLARRSRKLAKLMRYHP